MYQNKAKTNGKELETKEMFPHFENLLSGLETVIESFDEVEGAKDQLSEREAKILVEILERFKPMCRYIGERVETSYSISGGQFADSKSELTKDRGIHLFSVYEERGKLVSSRKEAPFRSRPDGDQNRGIYDGISYYLFPDGLVSMKWDGNWSNWQNEGVDFEAIAIRDVNEADIVELFNNEVELSLEDILKPLKDSMKKAIRENENKSKYLSRRQKLVGVLEGVLSL